MRAYLCLGIGWVFVIVAGLVMLTFPADVLRNDQLNIVTDLLIAAVFGIPGALLIMLGRRLRRSHSPAAPAAPPVARRRYRRLS